MTDWVAWHAGYDDPSSSISERLLAVQEEIEAFLARTPPGPVRVLSACSGLGLDVIGVLREHPRRRDVSAVLVELHPDLVTRSTELVSEAGLEDVEVRRADAGLTSSYVPGVPADLLLLCGVFGNVSDDDIRTTAANASRLCAPGATVVWTRHRREPDLTPSVRSWFTDAGWQELGFRTFGVETATVGIARLVTAPLPFEEMRLFAFD